MFTIDNHKSYMDFAYMVNRFCGLPLAKLALGRGNPLSSIRVCHLNKECDTLTFRASGRASNEVAEPLLHNHIVNM